MASIVNWSIAGLMVMGGIYLHQMDTDAQVALAESRRVEAETQDRLRRVQEGLDKLAMKRQAFEENSNQRLQQLAETETRIRNETDAATEAENRHAELLQRQNDEERQRIVLLQRQQEDRLRQEELHRVQQAERLAAAESRIQLAQQALVNSQRHEVVRPMTVIWAPHPQPVVFQDHHQHHQTTSPATPSVTQPPASRHCERNEHHGSGSRRNDCN